MTQGSSDLALPAKRKHTLASKLTSEENAYTDMFKKRKLPRNDRRASVEIIDDDDIQVYPSGQPRNPSVILEAADGSDDDLPKMPDQHKKMAKPTASRRDRRASVETIDDDEFHQYPSGQPKNPTAILEAADGSDDDLPVSGKKKETATEELGEYQKIYYLLFY